MPIMIAEERRLGRDEHRHPPPAVGAPSASPRRLCGPRTRRRSRRTRSLLLRLLASASRARQREQHDEDGGDVVLLDDEHGEQPARRSATRIGHGDACGISTISSGAVDERRDDLLVAVVEHAEPSQALPVDSRSARVPVRVRARHRRDDGEVVLGRRRRDRPLERRPVPRVDRPGRRARCGTTREVAEEQQDRRRA